MKFMGWFIVLLIMFSLVVMVYIALDKGHTELKSFADSNIIESESQNTVKILNLMWVWFPILMLFTMVMYIISRTDERSAYE